MPDPADEQRLAVERTDHTGLPRRKEDEEQPRKAGDVERERPREGGVERERPSKRTERTDVERP